MAKQRDWRRVEIFCAEYLITMNAQDAAIKAGYSARSAKVQGSKLLAQPKVQEYLKTLVDARKKRLQVDADQVVEELAAIAFGSPLNVVEFHGDDIRLKDSKKLSEKQSAIISSLRVSPGRNGTAIQIGFQSKTAALGLLMKHLGMGEGSTDDPNADPLATVAEMIERAYADHKQP